mgnify:CR=1 FL=1
MPVQAKPSISQRKKPKQNRSAKLVDDILAAATQVLAREGAHRFTTARVAERAGVSIGSLYQYFPSKQAILFRLQLNEWENTGKLLREALANSDIPPRARLRRMIEAFFRSEEDEAQLRMALGDAVPLYRDALEISEHRQADMRVMQAFMAEALPRSDPAERDRAADLILMAMQAIGQKVTGEKRDRAEIDAYARDMADMACAYLDALAAPPAA